MHDGLRLHIQVGLGYISIPMSWWFRRDWKEYFRVVQRGERDAGKTQLLADPAPIAPTVMPERMVADAEEMEVWSRKQRGTRGSWVRACLRFLSCSLPTTEALPRFFMIFACSLLAHVEAGLKFLLELR